MKANPLDHASDHPENNRPESGASDDARLLVPVSDERLDDEAKREFATYFQNAKRYAPPSKQEKVKRQVLARVRGWGDRYDEWKLSVGTWLDGVDLAPDLAENIGSRRWFRGLGTMVALGALAPSPTMAARSRRSSPLL